MVPNVPVVVFTKFVVTVAGSVLSGSEKVKPNPYTEGLVKSKVAVAPEGINVSPFHRPASEAPSPVPYTAPVVTCSRCRGTNSVTSCGICTTWVQRS